MRAMKALCLAFSMYSKIPMPKVSWNKENMRCVMCFFPLVGTVIGAALILWYYICVSLNIGNVCFGAIAAVLSVLITGGIHNDGFIDTNDALSSYGSKQKKLEILSDPHVGAFGIISVIVYYLIYFGFFNEIQNYSEAVIISISFVMSRSLCAAEIVLMRTAKNTGLLYEFSSNINKTATLASAVFVIVCCVLTIIFLNPLVGEGVLFFMILLILYYKFFIAEKIGGITGDTCGWFIQMCELTVTAIVVVGGRLV